VGYTPYEGKKIRGWPLRVFSRGRLVIDHGELEVEKGSGEFIPREKPPSGEPLGRSSPEAEMIERAGFDPLW
jgi:dihydropyrimidinase